MPTRRPPAGPLETPTRNKEILMKTALYSLPAFAAICLAAGLSAGCGKPGAADRPPRRRRSRDRDGRAAAAAADDRIARPTAPFRIAEIRAAGHGLVQKRLFTEGADVQAGDALYQIDPARSRPRSTSPRPPATAPPPAARPARESGSAPARP
jgi:membrane fusion protein (multidrug efflux system)